MSRNKTEMVRVRVSSKTLKDWTDQAAAVGLDLSHWIRLRCEGVVLVQTNKGG